jgi:hypothetical protein
VTYKDESKDVDKWKIEFTSSREITFDVVVYIGEVAWMLWIWRLRSDCSSLPAGGKVCGKIEVSSEGM